MSAAPSRQQGSAGSRATLRRAALAAACLLLSAVFVLCASAAPPALVDDSLAWASGSYVFDERDSCWYRADDAGQKEGAPAYKQVDGRAYPLEGGAVDRSRDSVLTTRLYPDGELVFQMGEWEHPSRLAGGCTCTASGEGHAWFRESAQIMARFSEQVTKVSFDASLLHEDLTACAGDSLSGWLAGLESCTQVEGVENLKHMTIRRAASMFKGCTRLVAIDLSELDMGACTDMSGMFDGCESLTTLTLGSGWTQATARAHGSEPATFPLDMSFTIAGNRTDYAAGDAVPSGFGTYVTTRADIAGAQVALLAPGGCAVAADQLAQHGWDGIGLPEGVTPEDTTVFSDIRELADVSGSQFEYTGAAIEPVVVAAHGGKVLTPGVHYRVSYLDNVQPGTATVRVEGIGAWRGSVDRVFTIADTAAYAFLYDDGSLVLQAGHEPLPGLAGHGATLRKTMRWFDAASAWAEKGQVPWDAERPAIKRVVIDRTFKAFRLKSLHGWFAGCTALTAVEGLANIDGAKLVDMGEMFRGCSALGRVDLRGFYSAHVETMQNMFKGCTKLTGIVLDASWQNVRAKSAAATFPVEMIRVGGGYARFGAGSVLPSGAGEYRTGGFALQLATVVMEKPTFACTGKPIEPALEVKVGTTKLVKGKDYTLAYADNVLPGKATVTVLGKGAFTGGLVVPFTIKDTITAVGDRLVYKTKQVDYTLEVLAVKRKGGRTVPARLQIVKVKVKTLKISKLVLPDTCTVGGVSVDVTAVGSKLGGAFRNVKCVVIGAKVTVIRPKAFAKAPKVKKLQLKTKRLTKATGALKGSKVKKVQAVCKLGKAKRKAYKKMFEKKAGRKKVKFSYAYKG